MRSSLGLRLASMLACMYMHKGSGIDEQITPAVQSPYRLTGAVQSRYAPRPNGPQSGKRKRQWR